MPKWKRRRRSFTQRDVLRLLFPYWRTGGIRRPRVAVIFVVLVMSGAGVAENHHVGFGFGNDDAIACTSPRIIDGDTFVCAGNTIRLAGIDAPEMPGHCRRGRHCVAGNPVASRSYLQSLAGGAVTCRSEGIDHYGRTIARCKAAGTGLSCAMVKAKYAVNRYGPLWCQ